MFDGGDTNDGDWGKIWVSCTDTDAMEKTWSQF